MFRTSPLEDLEERLSRLRAAVDEQKRLKARLLEAAAERERLEAEIAAARKRVTREARDVERFEAGGLITQIYEALNLADGKLEKERRELLEATLLLEEAKNELELFAQDTAAIEARLDELGDVAESYRKALAEKQKWLDAGAMSEAAAALERAERTGRLREWLREIDEAMYFGHRADATLRTLIAKLDGTLTAQLAELESLWAGGLPLAVLRAEQESLIQLTSRARHQVMLFYGELRDVHDRREELATALRPMDLGQLLGAFDNFAFYVMRSPMQTVTVEHLLGLRARVGTQLSQLQTLRNALASPGATADAVLRNLDLIHGE